MDMDMENQNELETSNEMEVEYQETNNSVDYSTLEDMNQEDPIEGPAANFLSELIKNAAVPINTKRIGLFIAVQDDSEESENLEDNIEQVAVIDLTSSQMVTLLKSNVQQFLSLLRTNAIDFSKIREMGKDIDFESEEFASLDSASQQYLEYLDRILIGAKSLAKENEIKDKVIETMAEAVNWAISNNQEEVYEDLSKMGKLLKYITWKLVSTK